MEKLKLSKNKIEKLILNLYNDNRLIAAVCSCKFIIYYYKNSNINELELDISDFDKDELYSTVFKNIKKKIKDEFVMCERAAIMVLDNFTKEIIDKKYLKLFIDAEKIDEDNGPTVELDFPNSGFITYIDCTELPDNFIKLFSLDDVKKALALKRKLQEDYLNSVNVQFSFITERLKNLSDEEKAFIYD